MSHRHIDAVKALAERAVDLANRLNGPRFKPSADDEQLIGLAVEAAVRRKNAAIFEATLKAVKKLGYDNYKVEVAAKAAKEAADKFDRDVKEGRFK